jgi:hypothetical protein
MQVGIVFKLILGLNEIIKREWRLPAKKLTGLLNRQLTILEIESFLWASFHF